MFSKTASFNIKGLACLGIAWHHYIFQSGIPTHFLTWFNSLWGALFVGIFFFLSGYGLTQSLKDKRPTCALFFKRIVRVLVPLFAIHLILYFPLLKLNIVEPYCDAKSIFGYLFNGSGNPYLWFVQAILAMYLCFFISSIPKSKNIRIILCFLLITIYCALVKYVLKYNGTQYANNFPFVLGYMVALYEQQIKKFIGNIRPSSLAVALTAISIALLMAFHFLRGTVLDDFAFMCNGLCGIPIMMLLNHFRCFEYRSFKFLGACSFELYIMQWWIISFMKNSDLLAFSLFSIFLYLGSCLLLAYIFSIIDRYLINIYDNLTKESSSNKFFKNSA